jgi:hypothetical protein
MLVAACGGDIEGTSARGSCYDVESSVCSRYYECYTAIQIAEIGLPPTVQGCATQLGNSECSGFSEGSCPGGLVFHPEAVDECRAAVLVADCALIDTAPGSVPACDAVCATQ